MLMRIEVSIDPNVNTDSSGIVNSSATIGATISCVSVENEFQKVFLRIKIQVLRAMLV
jgi:hypothetical protein